MFSCVNDEKIFQTLPGQGWRVLIEWAKTNGSYWPDDWPDMTLEPVIAWVTARITRRGNQPHASDEQVVIAPLVRWPISGELYLLAGLWSNERSYQGVVYLAPGEEPSEEHMRQLRGGYAKAVTLG
jgi:hypothetical protein